MAAEHDGGEGQGLAHGRGLGPEEEAALVGAVGHAAGPGPEEQQGQELAGGQHADGHAGAG